MTQLAYNTSTNQITDMTLFFINHEYNTNLFFKSKKAIVLTEQVNITAKKMQQIYRKLKKDIKFLLYRSAFYYNQHRFRKSILKKKNKVYLLWKNIEITRSSSKLNHIKIRSFKIIRNIKEVSFKLKLLKDIQWKHFVFHVSLLKPVSDNVLVLKQVSDNYLMKQEDWYKVEKILKHKNINKQRYYLVK